MMAALCMAMFLAQPLYEFTPSNLDTRLQSLYQQEPDFGKRIAAIAEQSLGTPYVGDPLGEGPDSKFDNDPLMDLAHVDCVTFIEQTIALASSQSYQSAFDLLQKIRYQHPPIAFQNRNHFMYNDWIKHNTFCKNITQKLGVPTDKVTRTISRRGFFEKKELPELGKGIPDEKSTLHYVPIANVVKSEAKLTSPALILCVGKIDWLFILHCGLYVRDVDGKGLVYQASSKKDQMKVITTPLPEFLQATGDPAKSRYLGYVAFSIKDPGKDWKIK